MPYAESTLQPTEQGLSRPSQLPVEPDESGDRLFGRRNFRAGWLSQNSWVRRLLAPPLSGSDDADVAAVTKIKANEITLDRMSRTPGRVIIPLTDQQAEQIKRISQGD